MKRGVRKSKEKQRLKIQDKDGNKSEKNDKTEAKRVKPMKKEMTWKMRILETH